MSREKKGNGLGARIVLKIVSVLAVCGMLFAGFWFGWNYLTKVTIEKKHALIEKELSEASELVLYKMRYSEIVSLKKSLLFAKSYSIVRFTGIVRAGIEDISKARIEISSDGKRAFIRLPPAEILGNDIVSQEVFDEKQSLFVTITTQEIFSEIDEARRNAEEEMVKEGLLSETESRAKLLIKQIVSGMGFETVDVK